MTKMRKSKIFNDIRIFKQNVRYSSYFLQISITQRHGVLQYYMAD